MEFGIYFFLLLNIAVILGRTNRENIVTLPRPMNHVGISVTDIDVAMKWYEDVLGFSVIGTPTEIIVGSSTDAGFLLSQLYGSEVKRVKMGHMSAGNGVGLEFFQFVDPPTQYPNTTFAPNQKFEYARAGYFHICVTDPNPEALVQRIVETGGEQISPILNIFSNENYKAVYCLDPFKNLLEVMSDSYERTLTNRQTPSSARRTI